MFDGGLHVALILFLSFITGIGFFTLLYLFLNRKRLKLMERFQAMRFSEVRQEEDVLQRPFIERTVGLVAGSLVGTVSQIAPSRLLKRTEERLTKAGSPRRIVAGDFLAFIGLLAVGTLGISLGLLRAAKFGVFRSVLLSMLLAFMVGYVPWFALARAASKRQRVIFRSLPDVMDLLVVSVEAGLAFDMALLRVVDKYKGPVGDEFQQALREMQLGKLRKDALKDMAARVDVNELSSLVNAVLQADQLGVGIGTVLRLQADMIRDKRQQAIEEQAMKAPIKMLFPLVFFIFPSIFIVILGPAFLNILKVFAGM